MKKFINSLRPLSWIKNLIVLIPLFLSTHFFQTGLLGKVLITLVLICLLSSATYLMNDAFDGGHAGDTKRLSRKESIILGVILVALSLGGAFFVKVEVGLTFLAFFVLSLWYSAWLKNILILDVIVVVLGMILRLLAGGIVIGSTPSVWLLLLVTTGSLIGLSLKRLKQKEKGITTPTLDLPSGFFQTVGTAAGFSFFLSYILFTQVSTEVPKNLRDSFVLAGIFLLYIVLRSVAHLFLPKKDQRPDYSIVIAALFGIILITLKMYFL